MPGEHGIGTCITNGKECKLLALKSDLNFLRA